MCCVPFWLWCGDYKLFQSGVWNYSKTMARVARHIKIVDRNTIEQPLKTLLIQSKLYKFDSLIGKGSFGYCFSYKCVQPSTGEPKIAVKRVNLKYNHEAQILAKLKHRNIVEFIGCVVSSSLRNKKNLRKFAFFGIRRNRQTTYTFAWNCANTICPVNKKKLRSTSIQQNAT